MPHETMPVSQTTTFAAELGSVAIGEEAFTETERLHSPLNARQFEVLLFATAGHTGNQAARHSGVDPKEVHAIKKEIEALLDAPNFAAATHIAIVEGILPTTELPDDTIISKVNSTDRRLLELYAMGVTNTEIAEVQQIPTKMISRYEQLLYKKIKAWNKPHAILRSHELGILSKDKARY